MPALLHPQAKIKPKAMPERPTWEKLGINRPPPAVVAPPAEASSGSAPSGLQWEACAQMAELAAADFAAADVARRQAQNAARAARRSLAEMAKLKKDRNFDLLQRQSLRSRNFSL